MSTVWTYGQKSDAFGVPIAIQKKFKHNYNSAKNKQALGALLLSFGLPYFPFGLRKGSGKDN
jgi:hypothetical protein